MVVDPLPRHAFLAKQKKRAELVNRRKSLRIGIPRVLNIWSTAPFWRTYFEEDHPRQDLLFVGSYRHPPNVDAAFDTVGGAVTGLAAGQQVTLIDNASDPYAADPVSVVRLP